MSAIRRNKALALGGAMLLAGVVAIPVSMGFAAKTPGPVPLLTNIDRTRQYGFELIAQTHDWPIQGMAIDANAAINDSKTVRNHLLADSEGKQFPRIPRWRVNADIRYAFTDALDGSIGLRYASRPNTDLLGTQRGVTFGYTSELFALDARMNWKLPSGFRVSAGVDNITNDRAWVFHPYPQRTFLIEVGWRL